MSFTITTIGNNNKDYLLTFCTFYYKSYKGRVCKGGRPISAIINRRGKETKGSYNRTGLQYNPRAD